MRAMSIVLSVLSLLACENDVGSPMPSAAVAATYTNKGGVDQAVAAATSSLGFAQKDGIDLDVFSLYSVRRLRYGSLGVAGPSMTSPHIERVRAVLKDKHYWETCYGVTSEETLGATYCFHLDEKTFELLTVYRMK